LAVRFDPNLDPNGDEQRWHLADGTGCAGVDKMDDGRFTDGGGYARSACADAC
jgi:hypothetical protein